MAVVKRDLAIATDYDPNTQRIVGFMARQLDEHMGKMKKVTAELTVEQLEWQIQPGHNTIGMLMAHCAVAEAFWVCVFDTGKPLEPDGAQIVQQVVGLGWDDDGMPAKEGSKHPETLSGKSVADYYAYLDKGRAATHKVLRTWTDNKLTTSFTRNERETSIAWVLYHVLEHFVEHTGQIQFIKHLMRDAGVLAPAPSS